MSQEKPISDDLGSCPFCGELKNVFLCDPKERGDASCIHIQCESCGAIGPVWHTVGLPEARIRQALIDGWNCRGDASVFIAYMNEAHDATFRLIAALGPPTCQIGGSKGTTVESDAK